jgi:putative CocE/NonD family hydrolase
MRRSSRWNTDLSGGIPQPSALLADCARLFPSLEIAAMPRSGVNSSRNLLLVVLCLFLDSEPIQAQGLEYVKAHYTKHEYRIPMRDGIKLFTCVYVPKDESARYPILLQRTPYGVAPYGVDRSRSDLGPSPSFGEAGYIVAYQDVRGCFLSEGRYEDVRPQVPVKSGPGDIDESSDTFDTIDWLVKHVPGHNGRVGIWGISYPGFYAAASLIDSHPALVAVSPQAPLVDYFLGDDTHHNGAFFLHQEFNFDAVFGLPRPGPTKKPNPRFDHGTPDAYDFFLRMGPLSGANELHLKGKRAFWNDIMKHGSYDDFWKERALLPHLRDVRPAVMTVGGWFDAEDLYGPLNTYRTIEATSPGARNILVMGPWTHGGWARGEGASLGPVSFSGKTSEFYREKIQFPFFEHHLKEKAGWDPPEAWAFETGRNQWHRHDRWPPRQAQAKALHLNAEGGLAFEAPSGTNGEAFDEFVSDPDHPVPYTATISINCPNTYMVEDQRFAARRPDVLVYQTGPLTGDVTIVGPIRAELRVSTTGTDADWVVKLIDVYPDDHPDPEPNPAGVRLGGYQQLVRGEVMRGKFRKSFERPEPFQPGVPTEVPFTIQDVYHTFRPGHRIMVQVQSSWFPLVDRNPQKFVDIYNAVPSDFRKATHRVYRSPEGPSRLKLLVMP